MKYGAILKACRVRANYTQEEFAHIMHINQSDVSKYENDTKEPSLSIVQSWTTNTQAQEVMVAFLCSVDGLSIMQMLTETFPAVGFILGGLLL